MSLAQDLRNVYYARGNDTFEGLVKKVEALEALSELRRKTLEQGQQIATLQGELDRCTCQSGPSWRLLIGGIGEPALCADCRKPITITAGTPVHHQQFGQACAAALVGQPGVSWSAPVRNAQGQVIGGVGGTGAAPRCDCGNQRAGMTFCESSCATQMNRFPPFS